MDFVHHLESTTTKTIIIIIIIEDIEILKIGGF